MEGLGEDNYGRLEGQDSFAGCPVLSFDYVLSPLELRVPFSLAGSV